MFEIDFKHTEVKGPDDLQPALEELRSNMKLVANRAGAVEPETLDKVGKAVEKIETQYEAVRQQMLAHENRIKDLTTTLPANKIVGMEKELKHFPRTRTKAEDEKNGIEFDPEFGVSLLRNAPARHAFHDFMFQDPNVVRDFIPEDGVQAMLRARRLHDTCVIIDSYMRAVGGVRAAEYERGGGVRQLKTFQAYSDIAMPFERALSEGSGAGGTAPTGASGTAWVPLGYGTTMIDDVRTALKLLAQFQSFDMPQNPYMYPVQGIPVDAYKIPEASGDFGASGYTAGSPTGIILARTLQTLNLVFTAVKLAALMTTSTELEEDSIVPIVPEIRSELAFAIARSAENCGWNGNLSSYVDTGWALGTPSTNTDARTSWDGVRYGAYLCRVLTQVVLGAGGLAGESFAQVKGVMGKFGGGDSPSDIFWGMSYMTFAKCLLLKDANGTQLMATRDKAGDAASWLSGVMARLLGGDVVVGHHYPQTLDANGLMTSTNNSLTSITAVNRKAYKVARRRGVLVEASRDRLFEYDQVVFKATCRMVQKATWTPGSGTAPEQYTTVGQIVNIPTQ